MRQTFDGTFAFAARTSISFLVFALGFGLPAPVAADAQSLSPYLRQAPSFNPVVTPQLPGDVDIALKEKLEAASKFAEVQREFDLNAWQMFLALAWPTDANGNPAPSLATTGPGLFPAWTSWHDSYRIFRTDGKRPNACNETRSLGATARPVDEDLSISRGLPSIQTLFPTNGMKATSLTSESDPRAHRDLGVLSSVGELNAANLSDVQQAFTGPLIDQNGEFVFYEILVDPNEVRYLCEKTLYNINGQVAFTAGKQKVAMPSGTSDKDKSGSFELKLAWKVIGPKDDASRFFTMAANIVDQGPDGQPKGRAVTVGLVGMHIGHKSKSSPQWIWATFEQVDNLAVDAVSHPTLHPSFTNPACPSCAVNLQPGKDANGAYVRTPTQAWRSIPIPADKVALNDQAQAALGKIGSVWRYYELIDTQWPTSPTTPPTPYKAGPPGAVDNKPGGTPTPVFLTNITMETYFQGVNADACHSEELTGAALCPPAWTGPKTVQQLTGSAIVFATESCMGCHSSAGVWTSYDPNDPAKQKTSGQLTGDFSWLLSKKASYAKP